MAKATKGLRHASSDACFCDICGKIRDYAYLWQVGDLVHCTYCIKNGTTWQSLDLANRFKI